MRRPPCETEGKQDTCNGERWEEKDDAIEVFSTPPRRCSICCSCLKLRATRTLVRRTSTTALAVCAPASGSAPAAPRQGPQGPWRRYWSLWAIILLSLAFAADGLKKRCEPAVPIGRPSRSLGYENNAAKSSREERCPPKAERGPRSSTVSCYITAATTTTILTADSSLCPHLLAVPLCRSQFSLCYSGMYAVTAGADKMVLVRDGAKSDVPYDGPWRIEWPSTDAISS
ncbi:hypothetical protein QBC35DRAFT_548029 [Podospora australis]|uniref:Uncharacterized protein n=1 Tax=Podospora australis TaxID=1536484 RepID=A0AAN6WWT1_9PEZI|nr:hypothetical protein QBC35DRAFT_548029 [Podospora australis]